VLLRAAIPIDRYRRPELQEDYCTLKCQWDCCSKFNLNMSYTAGCSSNTTFNASENFNRIGIAHGTSNTTTDATCNSYKAATADGNSNKSVFASVTPSGNSKQNYHCGWQFQYSSLQLQFQSIIFIAHCKSIRATTAGTNTNRLTITGGGPRRIIVTSGNSNRIILARL